LENLQLGQEKRVFKVETNEGVDAKDIIIVNKHWATRKMPEDISEIGQFPPPSHQRLKNVKVFTGKTLL
jgi:hypothetical protein